MSLIDQNLLSSTAASSAQYSASSSVRRNASSDKGFSDVFDKTSSRDSRTDYSRNDERNQTVNDDDQRRARDTSNDEASEASSARDSSGTENAKAAKTDEKPADTDAAEQNVRSDDEQAALKEALADLKNLDEDQIDELAAKLGMDADELAAALEELATAAADQVSGEATGVQEEDNIAALFRLLLGQKKTEGENRDTSGATSEDSADDETLKADDDNLADDITELLNALTRNENMQDDAMDGDDDAGSGASTFRFERADGKGVPVELQIGGQDEGADLESGKASSKVETVTVLDSRRYLAPADINATNLLNGMTGDKTWTAAMKTAAAGQVPVPPPEKVVAEVNTLKIQMHPQDLGTVTATLKLKGDDLIVNMSVHSAEAYSQLSADKDKIMQSLKAQGFSVDQINISFTASPERGVQQSASSQQHQDGQQMQGGANGDAARQEQQDGNRRQQSNGQNTIQTVEDMAAANTGNSAGNRDAGQIYL